jgi:hypothetical protein
MKTIALGGWACAFALTVGCGGSFSTVNDTDGSTPGSDGGGKSEAGSPDSGSSPDTGTNDGSHDTGTSDSGGGKFCPALPPSGNMTCSPAGLECEYGANPNVDCNELYKCLAAGWTLASPKESCPPLSACPTNYDSISSGKVMCLAADAPPTGGDLTCVYPKGTCICSNGSLPVSDGPYWTCIDATAKCPADRPRLGSACSDEGQSCDYGACEGGIAIACMDGYWQETYSTCPG